MQGFGGKFGVQTDRVDKSAHDFDEQPERVGTNYEKSRPDIGESLKFLLLVRWWLTRFLREIGFDNRWDL